MAEGLSTSIGHEKTELLAQVLKKGFELVTQDNFAMIIINDKPTAANNLMKAMLKHDPSCQDKLVVLSVLAALHSIGRCNTKKYTLSCSDPDEEITEWMSDPTKRRGDLVVSITFIWGHSQTTFTAIGGGGVREMSTLLNKFGKFH